MLKDDLGEYLVLVDNAENTQKKLNQWRHHYILNIMHSNSERRSVTRADGSFETWVEFHLIISRHKRTPMETVQVNYIDYFGDK